MCDNVLRQVALDFTTLVTERALELRFFATLVLLVAMKVGVAQVRPVAAGTGERPLQSGVVAEGEPWSFAK